MGLYDGSMPIQSLPLHALSAAQPQGRSPLPAPPLPQPVFTERHAFNLMTVSPWRMMAVQLDAAAQICGVAPELADWGLAPEAMLGRSILDWVQPSDVETVRSLLQNPSEFSAGVQATLSFGMSVMMQAQTLTVGNGQAHTLLLWTPLSSQEPGENPPTDHPDHQTALLTPNTSQRRLVAQVVSEFTRQVRHSLDLPRILAETTATVQRLLQADRVVLVQPQGAAVQVVEAATAAGIPTLQGRVIGAASADRGDIGGAIATFCNGAIAVTHPFPAVDLPPELQSALQDMDVQSALIAPVSQEQAPWGWLMVQHCTAPRPWHLWEVELVAQLSTQLESAIHHVELHQRVQQLNADLEHQVQSQTAQLQIAQEFEATLQRITDKVRDSLDEEQILQAAVQELVTVLGVNCCNAAIYDLEQGTSTIHYEYTTTVSPYQGRVSRLSAFPELYTPLLHGQRLQFCSLVPNPVRGFVSTLVVPMLDDKGILGDLWLINQPDYAFTDQDIRLAQLVANQCAIALRQARLYQAAQAQVQELERLNRLKDDFLSTVSHELRTPMSNIKMALQMLEIFLKQSGALDHNPERSTRYLKILHEESEREINLINDLLDLSRLDAGGDTVTTATIDLSMLLPPLLQPFEERTQSHQQTLRLVLDDNLPRITTDAGKLERVLGELLTNACKYTPANECITVSVSCLPDVPNAPEQSTGLPSGIRLSVINTGAQIPAEELKQIFEKFYRIPNHDPWQYGGTGLGLALVRKLVERMDGTVHATSTPAQTCFAIDLPLVLLAKDSSLLH